MAIIGIDLDGTLAKSLEENLTASQKEYFRNIYTNIKKKETKKIQGIIMTKILKTYFNIKWKNWQNIEMVENDIPEILKEIAGNKMSFPKINIVTSSYGKKEFIEKWLIKNNIVFTNLIFADPIIKYKYADILIDDRVDIVLNAVKHGKFGILYCKPFEDFVERFPTYLNDYHNLLTDNRIWKQRTVGIGVVSSLGKTREKPQKDH